MEEALRKKDLRKTNGTGFLEVSFCYSNLMMVTPQERQKGSKNGQNWQNSPIDVFWVFRPPVLMHI